MTNSFNSSKISIDAQTGALILIDMLYAQKLINQKTYNAIQETYNAKTTNSKKLINN